MIYCIWYPSGGFGHFLNAVLSLYGKNFSRPKISEVTFSNTGDSHIVDLVAPKYLHNPTNYNFEFDRQLNYSLLIDNGINDEGDHFKTVFPTSQVIKISYNDETWPIIAKTMIDKALKSSVDQQLALSLTHWHTGEPWAKRECYYLFLRDHALRYAWRPDSSVTNWLITDILDYRKLVHQIKQVGIVISDFEPLWNQWYESNKSYINPVTDAKMVVQSIKNNVNISLDHIVNIWDQAVVYYFLWLEFGQEVPHNDYADFFKNTDQIKKCLKI
jgi:hypothetical protein